MYGNVDEDIRQRRHRHQRRRRRDQQPVSTDDDLYAKAAELAEQGTDQRTDQQYVDAARRIEAARREELNSKLVEELIRKVESIDPEYAAQARRQADRPGPYSRGAGDASGSTAAPAGEQASHAQGQ